MCGTPDPPPANTTSSTTTNPWIGAIPYLTGKRNGKTVGSGVFPSARTFFDQYKTLNPEQQGLNNAYFDTLGGRQGDLGNMAGVANDFMSGAYDSNYDPSKGFTSGAFTGDLTRGVNSMGALDPSNAYQKMLSGQPDNPYLAGMHRSYINDSLRGYGDAVRDFSTQVLPGLGDQAFAAGQYGGSRQGIAEGLASEQLLRNARDLGIGAMDAGTQLYGNAYESAQGRMAGAADSLAGQAYGMEQFNAGQMQNAGQFNAGQLQNADQFAANLDLSQQQLAGQNAMAGLKGMQDVFSSADNVYNQQQALLNQPMLQYQNALNQYANIISPGAAMGGTSSTIGSIPVYSNSMGQILGGGLGIAGLLSSMGS